MAQTRFMEFDYKKEDGVSGYKLLVLNKPSAFYEGISLKGLEDEDVKKLEEASASYEAAISPFIAKHYRRFKPENIVPVKD